MLSSSNTMTGTKVESPSSPPEKKKKSHLRIPKGTTVVAWWSWEDWNPLGVYKATLTSVTFSGSMKYIGGHIFWCCVNLANVTFPDSVRTIGRGAFSKCPNLREVTFPNSVTVVEDGVFRGCTSLKKVTLSSSIKFLPDQVFADCPNLKLIDFGKVTNLDAPNRFPALNGTTRTAIVEHPLEGGKSCFVRRTWPASTQVIIKEEKLFDCVITQATYAATEPTPELVVNTNLVYGCFA